VFFGASYAEGSTHITCTLLRVLAMPYRIPAPHSTPTLPHGRPSHACTPHHISFQFPNEPDAAILPLVRHLPSCHTDHFLKQPWFGLLRRDLYSPIPDSIMVSFKVCGSDFRVMWVVVATYTDDMRPRDAGSWYKAGYGGASELVPRPRPCHPS
jgi:hypothetical protein